MVDVNFIEFESVFLEKDAPKSKSFCRLHSIEYVDINTAKEDIENKGSYYVWLTLRSGKTVPCFCGTFQAMPRTL